MIEPTDEMTDAAYAACEESLTEVEAADMRRIVAAVLAIVERDNAVEPYCGEESGIPGVRCAKRRNHVPVHYAFLPTGGMSW